MNNRFLIPATVALAVHGGLFFGFPKSPRAAAPVVVEDEKVIRLHPMPPPLDDLIEVDPTPSESRAKKGDPVGPPRSVEPAPVTVDYERFQIKPPPIDPVICGDSKMILEASMEKGLFGGSELKAHILRGADLDSTPRTRFQVAPIYPYEAKRDGIEGTVMVEFSVDAGGAVRDAKVVSSTHAIFESATLRAVSRWVFEPGRRHGAVVAFRMTAPVVFSLKE